MAKNRNRRIHPEVDTHHLLFIHRSWDRGYARALRDNFTRRIPVAIHRELHSILKNVPVPDGNLCREAWQAYCRERDFVDMYGPARACAWLYVHIPDVAFRRAMQVQIDFFTEKGLR